VNWTARIRTTLGRHVGPILVWVLAVAGVTFMLADRSTEIVATGLVQGRRAPISPVETGTLGDLEVELLQEVRAGQVLARMDEAQVRAEVALVSAEIEAVRQELALETASRQQGTATDRQRFAARVEDARLQVLEIKATLEPDRVTLADLDRDVASYRELLAKEMVSVREFERVEAERDALARRVEEHERLLDGAREELAEAERRREEFVARHGQRTGSEQDHLANRALASRITALERRLEMVLLRGENLALTAPFDGVVTQIMASSGQVLQPGEVVLTVAESHPARIVVWLEEAAVGRLEKRGDLRATLTQQRGGRTVEIRCEVARVGATIETKPPNLWRAPNRPETGRPVVLGVPENLHLVPGSRVTVRWS
jgi:multidrug resistance efflux pump